MAPRKSTQTQDTPPAGSKKRGRPSATPSDSDDEPATDYEDATQKKAAGKKGKGKAKGKKKAAASDDNEDEDDEEEEEGQGARKKGALGEGERDSLVQQLVRHALFSEYTRKPLKREDVVKTILKDGRGKHFPDLFNSAQKILRNTFGMELVQLRAKEGAAGKNPPKSYVLRTTLPAALLTSLATCSIPELVIAALHEDDKSPIALVKEMREFDIDAGMPREWNREEGAAYGVLALVLALILVNGKVLGEDQLVSYLKRTSLAPSALIPTSVSTPHPTTLSSYLTLLARQNYLERSKSSAAITGATQQKKPSEDAGDPAVEWRWGARTEVEIGETGVAKFIEAVMESSRKDGEGRKGGETGVCLLKELARAAGLKELRGPIAGAGVGVDRGVA